MRAREIYRFGPFELDATGRLLLQHGAVVPLTPKVVDTLVVLVREQGRIVERDALVQQVWPDTFVEEAGLTRNISVLRKVLEGGSDSPRYIETIPKRGYRFLPAVERVALEVLPDAMAHPGGSASRYAIGAQPARLAPSNLREVATPLVGRDQDITRAVALLTDAGVRWVTLTGLGGVGKTSLAMRVAQACGAFRDSVYVVSLAAIGESALVIPAIARTLGVDARGSEPLDETLARVLREARRPLLLMLDNLEHVAEASPAVSRLLLDAAELKVLATSRTVLHLSMEHEFAVEPLDAASAAALFAARAGLVRPGFQPSAAESADIATLCDRLARLPLAIELAAARIKLLPPAILLSRLEGRLLTLSGGARDLPDRQRTLRSTIDWSFGLLTTAEQRLFSRLAVFSGGWTLEAAEAVANAGMDLGIDLLEGMASLLDKNMIARVAADGAEPRFTMLELLREYGLEQLGPADTATCKRAHAAYCVVLAEEGRAAPDAVSQNRWLAQCDTEYANIRAAATYLIESGMAEWALRLLSALFQFWTSRGTTLEGDRLTRAALELPGAADHPDLRARALFTVAAIAHALGDYARAIPRHEVAIDAFQALGDRRGVAAAVNGLAIAYRDCDDYESATAAFDRAIGLWRETGDRGAEARTTSNLASLSLSTGDYAEARRLYAASRSLFEAIDDEDGVTWTLQHEGDAARGQGDRDAAARLYAEAHDRFRQNGDDWGTSSAETSLGDQALDAGDVAAAKAYFATALATVQRLGSARGIARLLDAFARVAALSGQHERALRLAGAAAALRQHIGAHLSDSEHAALDRALSTARATASPDTWVEGSQMPPDRAAAYALSDPT